MVRGGVWDRDRVGLGLGFRVKNIYILLSKLGHCLQYGSAKKKGLICEQGMDDLCCDTNLDLPRVLANM